MGVTIKDIAKKAGVSYSTVSKALRDSPLVQKPTKNKIMAIAEELGYQPNIAARSLVSKKSWVVGVVWPSVERMTLSALITKVNKELEEKQYTTVLSINEIDSAIQTFQRFQVDAILVFRDQANSPFELEALDTNIPILFYGTQSDQVSPVVDVNRKKAIELAVEHLSKLGHKKMAYIGNLGEKDTLQQEKVQTFQHMLVRKGIESGGIPLLNGLEASEGYRAGRQIIQAASPPTAILSGSYDLTRGLFQALHEAGLSVPQDISIASYDHVPQMLEFDPPVTSVGVPIEKVAEEIAAILLRMIDQTDVQQTYLLDPELAVRTSTRHRINQ
ncbi:LacI family transcriptional regulator [Halobacillus salinarum]|uniref:LacI family transcriptional regulator n=1 Tax=Halobacillus salinarum TaxID=2932257 RepID=A0ABY4EPN9_9BACI|nr:LacI family DNA-binding transcriptional regulator [Halobacillus salinarum]UOQ45828.1 LacI family transcriptional regulator [Halobacillus salinarum]